MTVVFLRNYFPSYLMHAVFPSCRSQIMITFTHSSCLPPHSHCLQKKYRWLHSHNRWHTQALMITRTMTSQGKWLLRFLGICSNLAVKGTWNYAPMCWGIQSMLCWHRPSHSRQPDNNASLSWYRSCTTPHCVLWYLYTYCPWYLHYCNLYDVRVLYTGLQLCFSDPWASF